MYRTAFPYCVYADVCCTQAYMGRAPEPLQPVTKNIFTSLNSKEKIPAAKLGHIPYLE